MAPVIASVLALILKQPVPLLPVLSTPNLTTVTLSTTFIRSLKYVFSNRFRFVLYRNLAYFMTIATNVPCRAWGHESGLFHSPQTLCWVIGDDRSLKRTGSRRKQRILRIERFGRPVTASWFCLFTPPSGRGLQAMLVFVCLSVCSSRTDGQTGRLLNRRLVLTDRSATQSDISRRSTLCSRKNCNSVYVAITIGAGTV